MYICVKFHPKNLNLSP